MVFLVLFCDYGAGMNLDLLGRGEKTGFLVTALMSRKEVADMIRTTMGTADEMFQRRNFGGQDRLDAIETDPAVAAEDGFP